MARLENAALTGAVDCKVWWVAKGKIPKGNIQPPRRFESHCYGSKRWLALTSSFGARGSQDPVQQAPGGAASLTSGSSGGYSSPDQALAVTSVVWNLWPICEKWQLGHTGNSLRDIALAFQEDVVLNFGSAIEQLENLDRLLLLLLLFTSVYFCPLPPPPWK